MIEKWKVTVPILTGNEERNAYIYLPESYYNGNEDTRYPVLYMFDGHNVFFDSDATYGKCWGMKEYMESTGTQMIIAAVECNHSPDHGRLKEYSPYNFTEPSFGKITGYGDQTMEWMIHTFKQEIDHRFRTLPDRDHTYIAGSSMGGLMSLYAVMEYNQTFSRAAALSPSIWVAPGKLEKLIREAQLLPDTIVYMDYGEHEMKMRPGMERHFKNIAARLLERSVLLVSRIVPGGTHCEACWEKQIPFFMNTITYPETSREGQE
ncbi:MAG: alpha/beta hydrolase [Marvinbryantia sp.]|uniref:alpha/beta hydrolase n=1 Tax=Marvinbryantia sp. TaxID=2496532 RepID=UPI0025EE5DCF|nr:alpha/beta hydrolase-fold protein [uncultured Marvinbryantia sp.]